MYIILWAYGERALPARIKILTRGDEEQLRK